MRNRVFFPLLFVMAATACRDGLSRDSGAASLSGTAPVEILGFCGSHDTRASVTDLQLGGFSVSAFHSGTMDPYFERAEAGYDPGKGRFHTGRFWPDEGKLDFLAWFPSEEATAWTASGEFRLLASPSDGDVLAAVSAEAARGETVRLDFVHCFSRIDAISVSLDGGYSYLVKSGHARITITVSDKAGYWIMSPGSGMVSGWISGMTDGGYPGRSVDVAGYCGADFGRIIADASEAMSDGGEIWLCRDMDLYVAPSEDVGVSVSMQIDDLKDMEGPVSVSHIGTVSLLSGESYTLRMKFSLKDNSVSMYADADGWKDGAEYEYRY